MGSLTTGTSFGDNILATLPDVIGGVIGSMVMDRVRSMTKPDAVPSPSVLKALGLTIDDLQSQGGARFMQAAFDPAADKNHAALVSKIKALFGNDAAVKKLTGWSVPSEASTSHNIQATQQVLDALRAKGQIISEADLASAKYVATMAKAELHYATDERLDFALE